MGAKDSKLSCISYEDSIKRGKVFLTKISLYNLRQCWSEFSTNKKKT